MSLEKTKILIINSRKDQLQQTAALLSRYGYSVLISDRRSLGYKIAREKLPAVVLHYINNVADLPDQLNVSELSTMPCKLIVLDTQTLVPMPDKNEAKYELWQGSSDADGLIDKLSQFLQNKVHSGPVPELAGKSVLVVDDELMNQTYYREVIRSMGVQCEAVPDLLQAEELLRQKKFDLVITDVLLGQTIGLVLAKVIRELKSAAKLVVVTGLTRDEFFERFGDFECTAMLHKPVNPAQLRNVVQSVILEAVMDNRSNDPKPIDGKSRYNPERTFTLLKHNEKNIREVMDNFGLYLSESLQVIDKVHDVSHLKLMRKPFHDLGNLCYYFGAEVLFELIGKYSTTQSEFVKLEMLPSIGDELRVVHDLHFKK